MQKERVLSDWRQLVNMTADEVEQFLAAPEGRVAGLSRAEAARQGIASGQDSARAIIRMKSRDPSDWTWRDWDWAQRQVAFIKRMRGLPGPLWDDAGQPTRKLLSLMLWGHLPEQVIDLHEAKTQRPGRHQPVPPPRRRLENNRAPHPFRTVETERQLRRRSSSDAERARLSQYRYAIAGIDRRGDDWSLGSQASLQEALSRARTQRTYPRAVVIDLKTGEMFE